MDYPPGRERVNLRHTVTPYVGYTIIFSGVTLYMAYVAVRASDWRWMDPAILLWLLFVPIIYFGVKYRILWDDTGVYMRASGGPERHIQFDEITDIRYELAQSTEFLTQSRPFRRIVIHGHKRDPNAFIDVSLRHFRLEDIAELMTAIHEHRPDLAIPKWEPKSFMRQRTRQEDRPR